MFDIGTRTRSGFRAAVALFVLAATWPAAAQQSTGPEITGALISGYTVFVAGRNLQGVVTLAVGDTTADTVAANGDGTLVTGTMPGPFSEGTYRLTLTTLAAASEFTCASVRPGADWVCAEDGGWVPPGHPLAAGQTGTLATLAFVVAVGGSGATGPAGPAGPAGLPGPAGADGATGAAGSALATMFASVYLTTNGFVPPTAAVLFDSQSAMSNATLAAGTGTIQLGGSGTAATFRIAWGVGTDSSCRLELMVNDVAQLPLTFGSSYYYGSTVTGEALVTIPDNAAIRLRAGFSSYCYPNMWGGGVGSRAFLTVMKIS
jgi:hypothetical protein